MSLEVRDLRFTYPGWPETLSGLNLRIEPGEVGFLLGPSGGGKTTLLRCIAGLERAYTGSILLDGTPIDALPPHERRVGMLFQEPALFPHLPVWRNVAFGLRYLGIPRVEEEAEAARWIDAVGLAGKAGSPIDELSGGQRQRVALARTLAARPRAVLLDEPLSALDRPLREELGLRICDELRQGGIPTLWVTHDASEARRLGDRTWQLVAGKATEESRSL